MDNIEPRINWLEQRIDQLQKEIDELKAPISVKKDSLAVDETTPIGTICWMWSINVQTARAERDRYRDTVEMYESWMKRSTGRHHGTVWNDIVKEYPYLGKK